MVITLSLMLKGYVPPAKIRISRRMVREMAVDPVCKMNVDQQTAKFTSEYKGKAHNFCALGCKRAFDKNPEEFLSPMNVDDQTVKFKSEYKGKSHNFCALGCKRAFDENPEEFLSQK